MEIFFRLQFNSDKVIVTQLFAAQFCRGLMVRYIATPSLIGWTHTQNEPGYQVPQDLAAYFNYIVW